MSRLIFLTGPARSGKSRHAVQLAREWGDNVVFVATYRLGADDEEMAERVRRHRQARPPWRTLEAPADITEALGRVCPPPGGVIIDCLTLWIGDRLASPDEEVHQAWIRQLDAFRSWPWPVIVVANEVGWGPVPEKPALRRFRDLCGILAQRTSALADEAWLLVAGNALRLK